MLWLRGSLAVITGGLGLAWLSGHLPVETHIAGAGLYAVLFLFLLFECRHVNLIRAVNGGVDVTWSGSRSSSSADVAPVATTTRWSLAGMVTVLLRQPYYMTAMLIAIVGATWLIETSTRPS